MKFIKHSILVILTVSTVFIGACVKSQAPSPAQDSGRGNVLLFDTNQQIENDDKPFSVRVSLNKLVAAKLIDEKYKFSVEYIINNETVMVKNNDNYELIPDKKESYSISIDPAEITKSFTKLQLKFIVNDVPQTNVMNIEFGNRNLVFVNHEEQSHFIDGTTYHVDLNLYSNNTSVSNIDTKLNSNGIKIISPENGLCHFSSDQRVCPIEYTITENNSEEEKSHQIVAVSANDPKIPVITFSPAVCEDEKKLSINQDKLLVAVNTSNFFKAYSCQKVDGSKLFRGEYKGQVHILADGVEDPYNQAITVYTFPRKQVGNPALFSLSADSQQEFGVQLSKNLESTQLKAVIKPDSSLNSLQNSATDDASIKIINFNQRFIEFMDNNRNILTSVTVKKGESITIKVSAKDMSKGSLLKFNFDITSKDIPGISDDFFDHMINNRVQDLSKNTATITLDTKAVKWLDNLSYPLHLQLTADPIDTDPIQNNTLDVVVEK